jgi:hypothetical protein
MTEKLIEHAPEMFEALRKAGGFPWVHNTAHTLDIENLRKTCLAYSEWFNGTVLPLLVKIDPQYQMVADFTAFVREQRKAEGENS